MSAEVQLNKTFTSIGAKLGRRGLSPVRAASGRSTCPAPRQPTEGVNAFAAPGAGLPRSELPQVVIQQQLTAASLD
jgi:hypothetical protein